MTCGAKVVRLDEIYMCTEFHINTCKYVWATHQVFWCVPGGAVEPLCHARVQPQRRPNCPRVPMCVQNFQEFLTMLSPPKMPRIASKSPKKEYWDLTRCHDNSILDINNPFTVSHRPCFYSILMKFEANWVKVRWWIQSILKMTHFLLPVGGAITLPHNWHINAIGFIHRTNRWDLYVYRVSY